MTGDRFDATRAALLALTVIVVLAAMRAAADFLIPLVVSVLLAYSLEPFVRVAVRCRIPRSIAAALVVILVVLSTGGLGYGLSGQASAALQRLPVMTEQLKRDLRVSGRDTTGPIRAIEEAAADLETAAREASQRTPVARTPGVGRVEIVESPLNLRPSLLWGGVSAVAMVGQVVMLVFFVYFVLALASRLKEKLIAVAGSRVRSLATAEVIDEINRALQRFLLIVLSTNAIVALASWLAFAALGLRQAAAWALLGGIANTIPYFGSAVVACVFFGVAYVQFGTLQMATVVAGAFVVITSLEGVLLKPVLMSRQSGVNGAAVFVGLLFFGWLWGTWGLLLAFPLMMVMKVVSDHVDGLKTFGDLIGD